MEENMKKFYLVLFTIVLFLSGCSTNTNTPTSKVEEFMSKYQRMDSEVLSQLDSIVSNNKDLTDDQKKDYTTASNTEENKMNMGNIIASM